MGQITVVCGAARSGRTAHIDALWRNHIRTAVLLTPTRRVARTRQETFARHCGVPGLFGDRAWEITDFARMLLEEVGQPVRMVSMIERRLMIRQALERSLAERGAPTIAVTPGLVRHLLRIINELKQAAIEPDSFRAAITKTERRGPFDMLVANVYDGYQDALIGRDRYDVPGLYWEVERRYRASATTLPNNIDTILLDGFDDFTLSQQRFIETLSKSVTRLVVGLNHDPNPDRSDLYHLQQRWIEDFSQRVPIETLTFSNEPPKTYVQYIGDHLFWRDPPPQPNDLTANVRIVPCADAQHEMESIGRQVKNLIIRDKVSPRQIAVCMTDIEQTAAALRAIFEAFKVPCIVGVTPSLLATGAGAFVMRLFEALDAWERNAVATLLASPFIAATSQEEKLVMVFPVLARRAGIVMGRDAWETRLQRLAEQLDAPAAARQHKHLKKIPHAREALDLLNARRLWLAGTDDVLPGEAPPAAFAETLDRQIGALDIDAAVAALPNPDTARHEIAAVRALRALLEQLAVTARDTAPMSRAEFVVLLREAMGETRVPIHHTQGPGVYCCGLDGMRHEKFDHVFIGGLNEGVLPRSAPINAVYAESDLRRLRKLGLPLPGQREHTYRQRLLFCHAVNAAQQELTFSWREQDTSGRDALPSPFLVDIADMFAAHHIAVSLPEPGPDCFLPTPHGAASERDLANSVYYQDYNALRKTFPEITASVDRMVAIETDRNSAAPFGVYDGCLQAPDVVAHLEKHYGARAQFSVNQLETYLMFPFRFFMERVLGIEETKPPEAELDPMTRGTIAHDALYLFHKRFAGVSVPVLLTQDEAGARTAMKACVHDAFRRNASRLLSVPAVIERIEKRRLEQALDRYLDRAANDFDAVLKPLYLEAVFGRAPRDAAEDLYVEEPFQLAIGKETFQFTGKIDRVDTDGNTACIIDYKSNAVPTSKSIKSGLSLQLTVYAWALEKHLLPGVKCHKALYYSIQKKKMCEALLSKKEEDFIEREENAKARIAQAIRGIRAGWFPPLPDESLNLDRTPMHTAARHEAWRVARKCAAPASSGTEQ